MGTPSPAARLERAIRPLAVAVAAVLVTGLGVVATDEDGLPGALTGSDDAVVWDPEIEPLAEFVAEARGLDFRRPVPVELLTVEEYSDRVRLVEDDLDHDDLRDLEQSEGELRALGLVNGDLDLLEAANQLVDAGTLAYYDPVDEVIVIRGTELTLDVQETVVHELTHALQDQHFDLEAILGAAEDDHGDDGEGDGEGDGEDDDVDPVVRGLVEGDAERIQRQWRLELGVDDRAALDEQSSARYEQFEQGTAGVPPTLLALEGAPYLLGEGFVEVLAATDEDAIDEAFRSPPDAEAHLLNPFTYLDGPPAVEVDLPLPEGPGIELDDERGDDDGAIDSFGAIALLVVLAERIDPLAAIGAVDGWAGDTYVSFRRDGVACVRAAFAGTSPSAEGRLAAAIDAWVGVLPGGDAVARAFGDRPGFEACDPGTEVDMALTGRGGDALLVPTVRSFIVADALSIVDADQAWCVATAILDGFTFEQLADPQGEAFQSDEYEQLAVDAVQSC